MAFLEAASGLPDAPSDLIEEVTTVRSSPAGFAIANQALLEPFASEARDRNLIELFTSSDAGEEAMRAGAVLPILGVPAWTYLVVAIAPGHTTAEVSSQLGATARLDGYYRLVPPSVIAPGEALENWHPDPNRRVLSSVREPCWVRAAIHTADVRGAMRLPMLLLEKVGPRDEPSPPLINPPFELEA